MKTRGRLLHLALPWMLGSMAHIAIAHGADAGAVVTLSGHPHPSNPTYSFEFPYFSFLNTSSNGVQITGVSVDDGSAVDLWDYVNVIIVPENGDVDIVSGDSVPSSGWHSVLSFALQGFDPGEQFQFSADPDTVHTGTGNVVDARPFLLGVGTVSVSFSDGTVLSGTWPEAGSELVFDPQRFLSGDPAADERNLYYQLALPAAVPEPRTWLMLLAGLGLVGTALRMRRPAY